MYKKWERVLDQINSLDRTVVAFSGGMDSTLVLKAASQAKSNILAVTARAEIYPETEFQRAEQTAQALGIPHIYVDFQILNEEEFSSNPKNRCYICKKRLLTLLKRIAKENNCSYVLDGTNADDLKDYRPGLKALFEEGILSPLKEAGLTKREVLLLAEEFKLPVIPSNACLASRIPYQEPITSAKLRQIEKAEALLHDLGFKQCRVRHQGVTARIEVPPVDLERLMHQPTREIIATYFEGLGFFYTALDLRGYKTGNLNKPLQKEALQWKAQG